MDVIEERLLIFKMSEQFSTAQRQREIGLDDIYFVGIRFGEPAFDAMKDHLQCGLRFCESALCIALDQNLFTQREEVLTFYEWFMDRLDLID